MNYFELFGIPVLFEIDLSYVKKKYYELSRKYHPDFFLNAPEDEQAEALEKSSMINRAYKIFQSPDETMRYVLELHHLIEEEEKHNLDPGFLMEVMEINEQLMDNESQLNEETLIITQQLTEKLSDRIYKNIIDILINYNEEKTTEKELLQIKDYYYKRKYLRRILDKIQQMRNIASL